MIAALTAALSLAAVQTPAAEAPLVQPIRASKIILVGDSTTAVVGGWGPSFCAYHVTSFAACVNLARGGRSSGSYVAEGSWDLALSEMSTPGFAATYVLIQFGHNDQKQQWPQTYAEAHTTYKAWLRTFIAEARVRGATPVLVTSTQRRNFDAQGRIINTHGGYPQAVREVAAEEKVALVDLDRASTAFYEALGPDRAPLAFSAGGKDATHHNNYGGYQLAKVVAQALRDADPELAALVSPDFKGFDPAHPDVPETFALPASPARSDAVLRGN